jgi:hypothetical protein
MTFGADREASMATIIYDTEHVEVEAELSSRWLMTPEAVESLTGWTLKPEGFCRGDVCSPIFNPDKVLSFGMVDLQEAAPLLGLLAVTDPNRGVAAVTASAHERADEAECQWTDPPRSRRPRRAGFTRRRCAGIARHDHHS